MERSLSSSGVLVGKRFVLTAAHAVYEHESSQSCSSGIVHPGKIGGNSFFGCSRVQRVFVHPSYCSANSEEQRKRYDIALVLLKNELGQATGWPSIAVADPASLR